MSEPNGSRNLVYQLVELISRYSFGIFSSYRAYLEIPRILMYPQCCRDEWRKLFRWLSTSSEWYKCLVYCESHKWVLLITMTDINRLSRGVTNQVYITVACGTGHTSWVAQAVEHPSSKLEVNGQIMGEPNTASITISYDRKINLYITRDCDGTEPSFSDRLSLFHILYNLFKNHEDIVSSTDHIDSGYGRFQRSHYRVSDSRLLCLFWF
ncbi:hypothetical protein CSKR_103766 [Clonorchis sinensis]|uniref:Uncharacterized protein n=1 Tax=Clonorchis sinensis TaxID=79923 RepID=A0A419PXX6_CLOSI|nr:hypothetical protein CSKR_103766 [Clonorchis sinensis]